MVIAAHMTVQSARFAIPAKRTSYAARELRTQVRQALQEGDGTWWWIAKAGTSSI